MTAYSAVHLVLAGACVLMGSVHLVMFAGARSARANLWVGICFFGFVPLSLGIGGSSFAAEGLWGSPHPWLLLGTASAPILWPGLLLACWASVERQLTAARRAAVTAALIFGIGRLIDVAWLVRGADGASITWEVVTDQFVSWSVALTWLVSLGVCGLWVYEALAARRRRGNWGILPLFGAVPAFLLTAREVGLCFGWLHGPSLFGITAFAFSSFASLSVAGQYIEFARRGRAGFQRYRVIRTLGRGGMGELSLATLLGPNGFHRLVALKKMLVTGDGATVQRFLDEARLAAQLQHPNIVAVHDVGEFGGGWFIEMEYLSGVSLEEVLDRVRVGECVLPVSLAAWAGQQICRGLAHAHRAGVIHRDIKPSNVMVTFEGELKLIDFGIAKAGDVVDVGGASPVSSPGAETRAGLIAGSQGFIAPERFAGAAASPASDIYSVAVVLRLLVEPLGFERSRALATTVTSNSGAGFGAPATSAPPGVPEALWAVVQRGLAQKPEDRFATADEMRTAVVRAAAGLPEVDAAAWLQEHFTGKWTQERAALSPSGGLLGPSLAPGQGPTVLT